MERADNDEERAHGGDRREHGGRQDEYEDESLEPDGELRQPERRERTDGDRQGRGARRHDGAVRDDPEKGGSGEDRAVVFERRCARQHRRQLRKLGIGLEAGHELPEERSEAPERNDKQRHHKPGPFHGFTSPRRIRIYRTLIVPTQRKTTMDSVEP